MPEDRPKTGRHEQDDSKARKAREERQARDEQWEKARPLSDASPVPSRDDDERRREETPLGGMRAG